LGEIVDFRFAALEYDKFAAIHTLTLLKAFSAVDHLKLAQAYLWRD